MIRNPLTWAAALLCVVLAASAWMLATAGASALGKIGTAADAVAQVPAMLDRRMTALQSTIDAIPSQALKPVNAAVEQANARIEQAVTLADARTGEALGVVKQYLTTADARLASIQGDVRPVLNGSTTLLATYAALPTQFARELRPSWAALQPEITCRKQDGSGYGGCWHGRITGLMGEALNVGGVFTRNFPALSDNVNGITTDFHSMTKATDERFFHPPPIHGFWPHAKRVAKDVKDLAVGTARVIR